MMVEYEEIYGTKIKIPEKPPHDQILNYDLPSEDQLWVRQELPDFF